MSDDQTTPPRRAAEEPSDAAAHPERSGAHASESERKRRPFAWLAAVVALALIATGGWLTYRKYYRTDATVGGSQVPVYTPSSAQPTATKPVGSAVKTTSTPTSPAPAGCSSPTEPMDNPQELTIDKMKVKSPMLSLGLDESGAAAAPPKNASHTTGWYNKGPKIGSNRGNVILTIHTYRNGGALGNELNDEKSGIKAGDLVRVTDDKGKVVCYTMERALKIWVKDYDPNSNVLYDNKGKPQAVIVICWDFNWDTKDWDSRILYYLKPVAPAKG